MCYQTASFSPLGTSEVASWAMKGSTFSAHQVVAVDLGIAFLVASVRCYRNRATVVGFDKLDDLEPFGDAIVIEANGGRVIRNWGQWKGRNGHAGIEFNLHSQRSLQDRRKMRRKASSSPSS
uniref:Uncharacterized protein n=1 Tax=Coccidioides posadasii RMSCC 3488 TaxID=454284 RepID=A0A0J6F1W5_COCPO|nr:hypothetical protein CPAG_00430 [Coccidioides posadasii RMSCC 3488]